MVKTTSLILSALLFTVTAHASESTSDTVGTPNITQVGVDDVLSMMAAVPAREGGKAPGHFDKLGDSQEIAEAIASVTSKDEAPLFGDRKFEAALMVVFAAYESSNQKCVTGDHGLSKGAWQIRGLSEKAACTPRIAAKVWLHMAKKGAEFCSENPDSEKLAALVSGLCRFGIKKTRGRYELARSIIESDASRISP